MVRIRRKVQGNLEETLQKLALRKKDPAMYKAKDRSDGYLFKELSPFGGQLDSENRWLKIKAVIPWEDLEREYSKHFSTIGRPALDGRLVIGLFLLKHMTVLSDRDLVLELQENVYWQVFCGLSGFETTKKLDASTLTKIRQRLGLAFVRELERLTYKALIDRKIIRGKGMLVDATVVPEKIRYPNDVGLLNDVREWAVRTVKKITEKTGQKIRTYSRTARKIFLSFSKKRMKTYKEIQRTKKQMIQFVRRNIEQVREGIDVLEGHIRRRAEDQLQTASLILEQQKTMYDANVASCAQRVVSFWRSYVRPIKRGKSGAKNVEFGPKVSLSQVDGFTFVDAFDHENYSEARVDIVEKQLRNYEERFGHKAPSLTGDQLYGSREDRALLKAEGIRSAARPLGRPGQDIDLQKQYVRRKQKERNRIEGGIGNSKEHYGCDGIRYHGVSGSEVWTRLSILAQNLMLAEARMA